MTKLKNMKKTYNITTKRSNGIVYNRITFRKQGVTILDISWNPEDKEAETQAIKSADMTVIRHGLKYKTRNIESNLKTKPMKPNTFFKVNSIEEIEKLHADPSINICSSLNADIEDFIDGYNCFRCNDAGDCYITLLSKTELISYKHTEVENPFTKLGGIDLSKVWANCKITDPYIQFQYNFKMTEADKILNSKITKYEWSQEDEPRQMIPREDAIKAIQEFLKKPNKIYLILKWFYEGDSNLVNSFVSVKSTYEEALNQIPKGKILLKDKDFEKHGSQPEDWGQYGSESRYEIRKINLHQKQKDMKNLEQLKAEHKAMGETIAKMEKENQHDWSKPQFYKSMYSDTVVHSTGKQTDRGFEAICINQHKNMFKKGELTNTWIKDAFKPHKVDLNL